MTATGRATSAATPGPEPEPAPGPQPGPGRAPAAVAVLFVVVALIGLAIWVATGPGGTGRAPPPGSDLVTGEGPPSAVVRPTTAAATATSVSPGENPFADVVWEEVGDPLGCGDVGVDVLGVYVADLTRDSRPEATLWMRCAAGAGNPPSALLVYAAGEDAGPPRLFATLLKPADSVQLTSVHVSEATVRAAGTGYSSRDVPRCCPDRTVSAVWRWDGSAFRREG